METRALRLRVPPDYRASVLAAGSSRMLLGFRPEHVTLRPLTGGSLPDNEADATVVVVEPLGPQIQVTLMLGEMRIIVLAPSGPSYRPHDRLRLKFDMDRCQLFADDNRGLTLLGAKFAAARRPLPGRDL